HRAKTMATICVDLVLPHTLTIWLEVAVGILSGSLYMLADAVHMLTDFASLALAWFAFRLSRRPATWRRTYGFDRLQVLVAFVNEIGRDHVLTTITCKHLMPTFAC